MHYSHIYCTIAFTLQLRADRKWVASIRTCKYREFIFCPILCRPPKTHTHKYTVCAPNCYPLPHRSTQSARAHRNTIRAYTSTFFLSFSSSPLRRTESTSTIYLKICLFFVHPIRGGASRAVDMQNVVACNCNWPLNWLIRAVMPHGWEHGRKQWYYTSIIH